MQLNKIVLSEKLASLNRCLQRIKDNTPHTAEELLSDVDKQDIVNLNLQRSVQISVDIAAHILSAAFNEQSKTMSGMFLQLAEKNIIEFPLAEKLAKAVGFRNIAVHEYNTIDMHILYSIITKDLTAFYEFGKAVLKILH